jgi:FKBP-type peptidyl-prolyl cis-trans isomerase
MSFLRKNWLPLLLLLLIIGSLSYFFKRPLSIFFGGWEKTQRGDYCRLVKGKKFSKAPGPGHVLIYKYLLIGPAGDTIVNKAYENVELQMPYPQNAKNQLEDALTFGSPGAVVELLVPTDTLKVRNPGNMKIVNLPAGDLAKFQVHILQVLNQDQFAEYQMKKRMERVQVENKKIDLFAAKINKSWVLDSVNWVKYYIENSNPGDSLKVGDKVSFHAEVSNLEGKTIIYSAPSGRPILVKIGQGNGLAAYDVILSKMLPGETGVFLVTSDYGYGAEGEPVYKIAPYSPLLIKITQLQRVKD